jgi:uncharacterized protein (DUF302 family)
MRILAALTLSIIFFACESSPSEQSQTDPNLMEISNGLSKNTMMITKTSKKMALEVIDSLKYGIDMLGLSLFTEIPHHKGAEKAGLTLPITHVLIFGNPKVGTKLMLCDQKMGYELPLKILITSNQLGGSSISYRDPKSYLQQFDLADCQDVLEKVSGMLDKLTNKVL